MHAGTLSLALLAILNHSSSYPLVSHELPQYNVSIEITSKSVVGCTLVFFLYVHIKSIIRGRGGHSLAGLWTDLTGGLDYGLNSGWTEIWTESTHYVWQLHGQNEQAMSVSTVSVYQQCLYQQCLCISSV